MSRLLKLLKFILSFFNNKPKPPSPAAPAIAKRAA